jgi:hypothetical protein
MDSSFALCPLCEHALHAEWQNKRLDVRLCSGCGHRIARHLTETQPTADYHQQYDQGSFVDSLGQTRRRQAGKILAFYTSLVGPIRSWLDFGCGRGWFLETAQKEGITQLAGADISPLSLSWLREKGFQAIPCRIVNFKLEPEWPENLHTSQVISFLDVLEHFEPQHLVSNTNTILDGVPKTKWVVIKVPVSRGLLFRLANCLRHFGWTRPLEQMFQVGTHPPHYHYFSTRSLQFFLKRLSLDERGFLDDNDFDDLSGRIQFPAPEIVKKMLSGSLGMMASIIGRDTRIVFANRH